MLLAHAVVAVLSLSHVWLFGTPWTAVHQSPLSSTISQSLLKFKSIDLVVPYNHLILCCPLLLPSIFPSIRLGLFQWIGSYQWVANVLEFQLQHQSFQWIFRDDFLWDWLLWSPCSPRNSQKSSPAPHFLLLWCSTSSFNPKFSNRILQRLEQVHLSICRWCYFIF